MADIADANPTGDGRLTKRKRFLDDYRNAMAAPNTLSQRDVNYYNDEQLNADQRRILTEYGNPTVTSNRIKPAVNGTIGVVARSKTDPRAYSRHPQGDDAADVASDVLRYAADKSRFQRTKLLVLKDILVPGTGASIVEMDGEDINVVQIPWNEYFYDPRSRRDDLKDRMYDGIAKWMYADQVKQSYPDFADVIDDAITMDGGSSLGVMSQQEEDRPNTILNPWFDKKFRRLMVVEVYFREEGEWMRSVYCGAAILEEGLSPYRDEQGRTVNPIEAQSGYVDSNNRRSGMVRTMIPMQDVVNMARQRATHLANTRQVQQVDMNAPPVDAELARREARLPGGVIPPGWQIVPTTDMINSILALQQEAKGEIERMAPIPSIVGRADSSASGRAQLVQSQAGMTEFAMLFDSLTDWEYRIYKQIWMRARQFWQAPMFIRVTGDDQAPRFMQINEPVTNPMTGQPVINPMTGQPEVKNHLATMDMDIVVDSVPDTANLQQEQWSELVQLIGANAQYAAQVPFSLAVKMSSIVNKRELVKELEGYAQQQQQAAQAQQQLAQQAAQTDLAKTQSETEKNRATAQNTEAKTVQMAMDAAMLADPGIPGGVAPQPAAPEAGGFPGQVQ